MWCRCELKGKRIWKSGFRNSIRFDPVLSILAVFKILIWQNILIQKKYYWKTQKLLVFRLNNSYYSMVCVFLTYNENHSRELADTSEKYNPIAFFVYSIEFNKWIYDQNNHQNVNHEIICDFGYKTFIHVKCKAN